jgi:acyl-[acyl-carrier-protein]-phospholipid O-acyltransferase / long-chain-fatty-acid--[acyl-carrier-protein] ligase
MKCAACVGMRSCGAGSWPIPSSGFSARSLYATDILQVDEAHSNYLLVALSLGIAAGSFTTGYASRPKIEMGMVLPGLSGIVLTTAALFLPSHSYQMAMLLLLLLGVSAGFFLVPVNAMIQNRPAAAEKGRVIRASNLLSFGGTALQPFAQFAMLKLGHPDPSHVFLLSSVACIGMALLLGWMLPDLWPSALYWTRLRQRTSL